MARIKEINQILFNLKKDLEKLETSEPTPENLEKVRWIEKRAKELKIAREHIQRELGMKVTA